MKLGTPLKNVFPHRERSRARRGKRLGQGRGPSLLKLRTRPFLLAAVLVVPVLALGPGCTTLSYYSQAVGGHLELMRRAEPVADALASETTPEDLRAKLARAIAIREFASRELGLPDNGSYRRYADLGRPYVSWNVFAAPEFDVRAKESCFPIAGCVAYRGYYARDEAEREAAALRAQGYDVFVGGVPAYSTLGWFDDPLLNTFINYPDPELARLVFHELAHQVVYVKDDSAFNESFAVAVEEEGARRWLAANATPADRDRHETLQRMRRDFLVLVARYRDRLEAFYAEPGAPEAKRHGKQVLFDEMRADYERLKVQWGGFAGFDRFFSQPNNALLVSISTYNDFVPAFQALLAREEGDLPRFYGAVKTLARLSRKDRDVEVAALASAARVAGAGDASSGGDKATLLSQ